MRSPCHWQRAVSAVITRSFSRRVSWKSSTELFPRNIVRRCRGLSPVGSREDEEPIVGYRDAVTALVHEPVMKAAQRHEVRELGLSSVGPVLHVMPFAKPRAIAAGVATAAVTSA